MTLNSLVSCHAIGDIPNASYLERANLCVLDYKKKYTASILQVSYRTGETVKRKEYFHSRPSMGRWVVDGSIIHRSIDRWVEGSGK